MGKPGHSACSGSRRSLVQIQLRRLDCGGATAGSCARLLNAYPAGSIPASAAHIRKGKPMGDGSCLENSRAMSLVSSILTPSAFCALGRAAEVPAFQAGEAGSTPAGHFLNSFTITIPGSSLLVVMPDFESGVRRFDSYPRN